MVNWKQAIFGVVETAIDVGASFLPGGSVAKKMIKKGLKGVSRGVGFTKDLLGSGGIDGLGELSANFDDKFKKGFDQAKSDLENESKKLQGAMDGMKSELEDQLKQQGEKFDQDIKAQNAKIATLSGEQKRQAEAQRKALQKQKQELESKINEVTEQLTKAQNQLRKELDNFKNEVNERFEQQEQKILENKRRIEEERIKREEEIREVKDNIKLTNTNLENLRKDKEQLEDEFITYKSQINQQTAETQQSFEDSQAEFDRRTRIVEAQIEDNQETIEEFNEQLNSVQREQAQQKLEQEEILEELQETNDILFTQQHKINLVSQQMEEIHEEVHERMDKLSQKLDDRINETLNIAQDTNKKIDKLTAEVQNIQNQTEQLHEQIKQNKEETEKVKKEAKLANERLDNLIKAQSLADYSAQESKIDKIQKSLELKAEEAKLLATLNLLQETKKLIPREPAEREWKVGIKEGKETQIPRPEGFPLNPNSSWANKYTPEQLREWGWDTRLFNENETAPLTDEEKRKEQQVEKNKQEESKASGEETKQAEVLEKIEELKSETLTRLQEIQAEIRTGLEQIEEEPIITKTKPSAKYTPQIKKSQQKIQQLTKSLTQKKENTKQATQKSLKNPTPQNKKEVQQSQQEEKNIERQLEQAQSELQNLEKSQDFEQDLEKQEEEIRETEKTELEQTWTTIQALSQQALEQQEQEEPTEHETDKKLEELTQQIKEMEQAAAASQKTMTMFMLFLIIFLLEYVVYKRNGLPGLVILNVILAVCYYHRETLKEYSELWGKYLLIIGYVMGNVLAYSAPEQEKYKWPSVIGFNLAILGIYAYTYWQKNKEQSKIETHYQQQTKEFLAEMNFTEQDQQKIMKRTNQMTGEQTSQILGFTNPFSSNIPTSQKVEQFGQIVEEQLVEQEIVKQKELEIQQQVETLQKAAEIEKKLTEARNSLGATSMSWQKIYEKYPDFKDKSLLLKEFEKAEKIIKREESQQDQLFLTKLTKIPVPSSEEQTLLAQLHLTTEQFIALSSQAQYLTREEKETLPEIYPTLTTPQKLQLLNSGLNNLEINTLGKKQSFVQLNQTLYQEKANFGLSTPEKENILRLLITSLDLSTEQRTSLENMGIRFFDASNWEVSNEQKNSLLSFGCAKIKLTEEQQENLLNTDQLRNFSLTEPQKNILQSVAPLTREDKYSVESLQLLRSLNLKPTTLTFLTNEEILPNPNLDFGETKSPYLSLKIKLLEGEQKTLQKQQEIQEKQTRQEEVAENKKSIILSLAEFAEVTTKDYQIAKSKLAGKMPWESWETQDGLERWRDQLEKKQLNTLNYSLTDWVKLGAIKEWQKDILLTLGLKTVPKYNFFELLIFAVENLANTSFAEFLVSVPQLQWDYQNYLELQQNQPITVNKKLWEKFASSQSPQQKEVLNNLDLEELINQQIRKHLSSYQPPEKEEWEDWLDISLNFSESLVQAWKDNSFSYETCKEWIDIGLTVNDYDLVHYLKNELQLTPEEALNQGNLDYLRGQFANSLPKDQSSTSSRYDNLFANLSKEEAERQKKKLEREEAKKKLEEAERKRREGRLSEKDKKLKEDEERRAKERELAEQEEQKRREAEEARSKSLQAEQETLFKKKMANIEEAKKRAEENLANQIKTNELAEKKKRDEITKMEKENQAEQERLKKQAELIEEEKQKKLAAIALEDKEERQRIEKKMNEEKAAIEQEMAEKKRKNDEELKKKENALLKEKQEKALELDKLEKEVELQKKLAEETKRIANKQVQILKNNRDRDSQLRAYRESLWNEIKDYYWASNEAKDGTRNPTQYSGGYLRDWLNSNPYMKFNLVFGDQHSVNWTNNKWKIAMKAFYGCAGNSFVDQYQFKRLLDQKVQSLDFTDSINV